MITSRRYRFLNLPDDIYIFLPEKVSLLFSFHAFIQLIFIVNPRMMTQIVRFYLLIVVNTTESKQKYNSYQTSWHFFPSIVFLPSFE